FARVHFERWGEWEFRRLNSGPAEFEPDSGGSFRAPSSFGWRQRPVFHPGPFHRAGAAGLTWPSPIERSAPSIREADGPNQRLLVRALNANPKGLVEEARRRGPERARRLEAAPGRGPRRPGRAGAEVLA